MVEFIRWRNFYIGFLFGKNYFLKLPRWIQGALVIIGFFGTLFFWEFLILPRVEWLKAPLFYIFVLTAYGGITLFSGYWLVRFTIIVLQSIPSKFGEVKMKEVPGLCGEFILYLIWILFTLMFLGATVNTILDPFDISLQSLGILPSLYPGYFLDNPVYIFGYKVIPICCD